MMIGCLDFDASSMTPFNRDSNSPFILAPASKAPTSNDNNLTCCNAGGTSPCAIAKAKPSTTAVLPTPASPVNSGLFWRRRSSTSIILRTSSVRPTTGSIFPWRANSVMSVQKRANILLPCSVPPAIAPLTSPGVAAEKSDPSAACSDDSGEPEITTSNSSTSLTLIFRNSSEIPYKTVRYSAVRIKIANK